MKRIVPFSRSITCAANAGSSASAATPARSRSDSEGAPNAEASASARRVGSGSPEIRARTSSSSVSGTGRGCGRVDVRVESTRQLEGEERISARPLVDAEQRLTRERPAEPVAQQLMERTDAERPHPQLPDALRTERLLEHRRLRAPSTSRRASNRSTRLRGEPAHRERERVRRRVVEPLDIVDREHEWCLLGEQLQRRCESPSRAPAGRPGPPPPLRGEARPRALSVLAPRAQAARRRGRPRTGRPARRGRGRARPRPAATRGLAVPALVRARCRRARASTSRCPASPSSTSAAGPPSAPAMNA